MSLTKSEKFSNSSSPENIKGIFLMMNTVMTIILLYRHNEIVHHNEGVKRNVVPHIKDNNKLRCVLLSVRRHSEKAPQL